MVCGDSSYGLGPGEKTTVNSVDDGLGADLTAAEEAAVHHLAIIVSSALYGRKIMLVLKQSHTCTQAWAHSGSEKRTVAIPDSSLS